MLSMIWIIAAAICLLYGLAVRAIGSGTSFFFVWIALAFVFGFFSYAAHVHLWSRLPMMLRAVFIIMVTAGAAALLIIEGLIVSAFRSPCPSNLDYLIVLGAQVHETKPSIVLQYRLDSAITYLNDNPDTRVIVSGGKGSNEAFPEAVVMSDYLLQNGISKDRIILENASTTTVENMTFSRKYIPDGSSVGIVTNNFHLYRALRIAEKCGYSGISGLSAKSTPFYLPNNMFREFFAVIKNLVLK